MPDDVTYTHKLHLLVEDSESKASKLHQII